jgi:hypothetical protein
MRALSSILGILALCGVAGIAQMTFAQTVTAQTSAEKALARENPVIAADDLPTAPSAANVSSSRTTAIATDAAPLPSAPSTTQQEVQRQRFVERVDQLPDRPQRLGAERLSTEDKFNLFIEESSSPFTFTAAGVSAGLGQATGSDPGFGDGWRAYQKRYGVALADSETSAFFSKFLIPVLAHQDPRYKRNGREPFFSRLFDAMSQVVNTVDDDGDPTFNYSQVLGTVVSSSISNLYSPVQSRGMRHTANRAVNGLGGAAGANVFREFWPDIKHMFIRHPKASERETEALTWHTGSQPSVSPVR